MVALIRDGVPRSGGTWADLGAGSGNFTWALRELLGAQATIYAVDRDGKAIRRQHEQLQQARPGATIVPIQADFTGPLDLPALDGVLMANALHFIRDQQAAMALATAYLRPGGRMLLIEYEVRLPLPWTPFPVSFARFQALAALAGLEEAAKIGSRVSPSSGIEMYAALAVRAAR
jgi:ubiquinone/menaquinone biosynthesis C-methylase UbiE